MHTSRRARSSPRWSLALLWGAAISLLGALLAFFALRNGWVLTFPYAVENGEGPVLGWVGYLTAGSLPYKDIQRFPWDFAVYTPGYFAATAALGPWLNDVSPWTAGRALSLFGALASAALLAWQMPRRATWLRWLPAALFLASPYLFRWSSFHRPDLFALWWSALGLLLVRHAHNARRPGWLIGAALAFVASFFTKQSYFAAPIAATLWLLWHERRWLPWLLLPGLLGGGAVALLLWRIAGPALWENLILANANAFSWPSLWFFQRAFLRTAAPLVGLALLAVGWPRRREAAVSLFGITLLVAWLVSFSVGKAGAWENYFLEPLWLLAALAGQALFALHERGGWQRLIVPLLVLAQIALFLPTFERLGVAEERAWLDELRAEQDQLHAAIAPLPKDAVIWSEEVSLLADSGRPVPLFPFGYTQLAAQGIWDQRPLTTRLATGADPLLVQRWDAVADPLNRQRWSHEMRNASERGFALGSRVGRWRLRPALPFVAADQWRNMGSGIDLLNWMAIPLETDCQFPSRERCLGQPLSRPVAVAGDTIAIHLLLQASLVPPDDLALSAQLFGPDGERVAQEDLPLRLDGLGGSWPVGAVVRDERLLTMPADLLTGDYRLLIALYRMSDGETIASVTMDRAITVVAR